MKINGINSRSVSAPVAPVNVHPVVFTSWVSVTIVGRIANPTISAIIIPINPVTILTTLIAIIEHLIRNRFCLVNIQTLKYI